jgi:hypothetical protein
MAEVAPGVDARADWFLDYLEREWQAVPDYAEAFETWDAVQQLAFVHEWDVRESALETLRAYAERGMLGSGQRARYNQLLELIARHRPLLVPILEA